MKLLLTNDDGIDAEGLAALESALAEFGEVTVVAPISAYSGCGHQVTTNGPIHVEQRGENRFAVAGSPADCVRLGVLHLAEHTDWVLSGINAGGNLGVDVWMSGTVAGAREGGFLAKPAIAFSQYRDRDSRYDWTHSAALAARVFREILSSNKDEAAVWNVNLPDQATTNEPPRIIECPLDPNPLAIRYDHVDGKYHYRGVYQDRAAKAGSDVDVCFGGHIALTKLSGFPSD